MKPALAVMISIYSLWAYVANTHLPKASPKLMPSASLPPTTHNKSAPRLVHTAVEYSRSTPSTLNM